MFFIGFGFIKKDISMLDVLMNLIVLERVVLLVLLRVLL